LKAGILFELVRIDGVLHRRVRLLATKQLTEADFRAIAIQLRTPPLRARKLGRVAARTAVISQLIETRWNGCETHQVAEAGDLIVTSLSPDGTVLRDRDGNVNSYVITADRFGRLYEACAEETCFGAVYRPNITVQALFLSGGFELMAPWGEIQRADSGYIVLQGGEVYGNNRETFEATYGGLD
jgi:hypothetical protein